MELHAFEVCASTMMTRTERQNRRLGYRIGGRKKILELISLGHALKKLMMTECMTPGAYGVKAARAMHLVPWLLQETADQ